MGFRPWYYAKVDKISVQERIFFNAVSLAVESSYSKLNKLSSNGSWENIWHSLGSSLRRQIDPEKEWGKLEKNNIGLLLENDTEYPPLLKEIPLPPLGLYYQGRLPNSESITIAIVGTRKATMNGLTTAQHFAESIGKAHCIIVSGLALGIDTAAHEGALKSQTPTIAVLARGLDKYYPSQNFNLAQKILELGGLIVSEYPPGTPALPYRFLERNRLISGLSRGVILIETPHESGSEATARFALDQNREVFVVPGPINHPNFAGSHHLIRQGATLVTDPNHILESIIPNWNESSQSLPFKNTPHQALNENEQSILRVLQSAGSPLSVDKIVELTNLNPKTTNQTLGFLIIKNIIKETESGYSPN